MTRKLLSLLVACFISTSIFAQLPPANIYLFEFRQVSDSIFEFTKPRYLTEFNPNGYNNHPAFFNSDELYISSQLPSETQPDLYVLNLKKKTKTRVTNTAEGEYSPFRMPDYYNFSAVRMEINGMDTTLRLWQFPMDRLSNGRPVFKYIQDIGYYYWLTSFEVALFKVDNPNTLSIADVRTDNINTLATNVGRCIRALPNGNLVYIQKSKYEPWKLVQYSRYNRQHTPMIEVLSGVEDFAVLNNGAILMGKGSKLFKYHPRKDKEWIEVVDLSYYDIRKITRLAISPDNKVAIVSEKQN